MFLLSSQNHTAFFLSLFFFHQGGAYQADTQGQYLPCHIQSLFLSVLALSLEVTIKWEKLWKDYVTCLQPVVWRLCVVQQSVSYVCIDLCDDLKLA